MSTKLNKLATLCAEEMALKSKESVSPLESEACIYGFKRGYEQGITEAFKKVSSILYDDDFITEYGFDASESKLIADIIEESIEELVTLTFLDQ